MREIKKKHKNEGNGSGNNIGNDTLPQLIALKKRKLTS